MSQIAGGMANSEDPAQPIPKELSGLRLHDLLIDAEAPALPGG